MTMSKIITNLICIDAIFGCKLADSGLTALLILLLVLMTLTTSA